MDDFEIFLVMAAACELLTDFTIAEIRQLLAPFEIHRFERVMSAAFPAQETAWPGLLGEEAATAVSLVAAMVETGDLPQGWDRSRA
jgi:hypothetical protein